MGDFSGQTRRDRQPCEYDVYLPDSLRDRNFSLDGDVAADVADAEAALTRLDASSVALADSEALARLLLRAESVASSRIEGLEIGARRLLRADAARRLGIEPRDVTAREILGNIDAMTWAVDTIEQGSAISVDTLLGDTPSPAGGLSDGGVRRSSTRSSELDRRQRIQSLLGIVRAHPPPEFVEDLLDDLVGFCNSDSLPTLAQAAVAHAQF